MPRSSDYFFACNHFNLLAPAPVAQLDRAAVDRIAGNKGSQLVATAAGPVVPATATMLGGMFSMNARAPLSTLLESALAPRIRLPGQ